MPGRKNARAWSDSDPPDDSAQRTNTQPMPIPKMALKTYCVELFCSSRTTSASPAIARLAIRAASSSFVGSQTALNTIPGIAASSMPRLPPSEDAELVPDQRLDGVDADLLSGLGRERVVLVLAPGFVTA